MKKFKDPNKVANNIGLKDEKGNIIVQPDYFQIGDFKDGFALVVKGYNLYIKPTYYYGAIDAEGNIVVDISFDMENEKSRLYVLDQIDKIKNHELNKNISKKKIYRIKVSNKKINSI